VISRRRQNEGTQKNSIFGEVGDGQFLVIFASRSRESSCLAPLTTFSRGTL